MADDTTPAGSRTGRWLKIALAASLALNLCGLGMMGGAMLKRAHDGSRGMAVRDLGFGPFTAALSPEDRAALRAAFLQRAPDLGGDWRGMRADLGAVLAALRADPFDAAALEAALVQQGTRARAMLDLGQSLMMAHLLAMTPEARAGFADRLEKRLTHGPGSKRPPGG